MTRLERLQAILIHLQSKKIVTAQELADRFDISIRTVYRDLRSLEEAGVPIGAEAGIGYFLTDNFHLPPIMFTKQEASALLLGAKFIDHLADADSKKNVEWALTKIKSVLQTDTKEHINQLHEHISVYGSNSNTTCDLHLQSIQKSLAECRKAIIDYSTTNNEITTNRKIVPLSLCFYGFNWHLIAFCELRNSYRDFRLDRIQKFTIDSESFSRKTTKQ
ncbi:MAG: YafY family transcriptional regulator [Bacteroidales bacterium]|nr:YafY family transcriptional regulator [Bacteroidales bacterium]